MLLPAGARLGTYEVLSLIGAGGMGEVYHAHDHRLERSVALKILRGDIASDDEGLRRFEQEARAVSALNHPNIVTIFDIGRTGGLAFYVMELAGSHSLRALMAGRPIDVDAALEYAAQIADGLATAHDAGIIHRDLKPENLILSPHGFVKIVDFGLAKIFAGVGLASDATALPRAATTAGVVMGTVGYMSPEQAAGRTTTPATDVFSLGAILYEMLTGLRPFDRATPVQTLSAIIEAEPLPVGRVNGAVPAHVAHGVDALLAKSPESRPAAREVARAMRELRTSSSARGMAAVAGLPAQAADTDRRHVSVLQADLADYGGLFDRVGTQEAGAARAQADEAFRVAVEQHDGVVQARDEAMLALFGIEAMREDDAVRAVRAACDFRERARDAAAALGAHADLAMPRAAVATGDVVVLGRDAASGGFRCAGDPLQLASRLLDAAEPNDILVAGDTWRLVQGFVEGREGPRVRPKGGARATSTYRVDRDSGARTRLEAEERRGLTPLAGRAEELALLRAAMAAAQHEGGRLVKIVGEPGIGKSRLLHEFQRTVPAGVRVLRGRCLPSDRGSRYLPFLDPMRELLLDSGPPDSGRPVAATVVSALRALDASLEHYAGFYLDVLGIADPERPLPEHLRGDDLRVACQEALATLFTSVTLGRPTALLIEDWHWADAVSAELLDGIASLASAYPLLIAVTARPEPAAPRQVAFQEVITLAALDDATTASLIAGALSAARVAPELRALVHERTGGNPLFVEELCRSLRDEGAIETTGDEASLGRPLGSAHLPDTVQAVLRARVDRMEPGARDLLRVAAVIGREFARGLLAAVAPNPRSLSRDLDALKAARMIHQIRVTPEPVFRFHHALLHEVTYNSLLLHHRRTLHGRIGDAIAAASAGEDQEALARHYTLAERWEDAAVHGLAAGTRARDQARFDVAGDLLDAAIDAVHRMLDGPRAATMLVQALLDQERVQETLGDRARQQALIDELLLVTADDPAARAEALLRQGELHAVQRRLPEALEALGAALTIRLAAGDRIGTRHVFRAIGFAHWQAESFDQAIATVREAVAISRDLGDIEGEASDLGTLSTALRSAGRMAEALECIGTALQLLERVPDPKRLTHLLHAAATLHRQNGRNDEARRLYERVIEERTLAHLPLHQSIALMALASLSFEEGDATQAIALYDEAADVCRAIANTPGLARARQVCADALLATGQPDEALARAREAAGLYARMDDRDGEAAAWRTVIRSLLARGQARRAAAAPAEEIRAIYAEALDVARDRALPIEEARVRNSIAILDWSAGRYAEAVHHYEAAVRLVGETDDLVHRAFLLNSLGAALKALGRAADARSRVEEALEAAREAGAPRIEAHALAALGDLALDDGRAAAAAEYFEESLALRPSLGDRCGEGWMRERLARALEALARSDQAAEQRAAARQIAEAENDDRLRDALRRG